MADFNWGLAVLSPHAALVKYVVDNAKEDKKANNDTATYKSKPQSKPQQKAPAKDPKVETEAAETAKKIVDSAIDTGKKVVNTFFPDAFERDTAAAKYTVKAGDSLSKIAQKTGCTVAELQAANNIDNPNKIREGQVLTIPGKVVANNKTEEIATDKNPKMNDAVGSGKIDRSLIAEPQKVNGKIVPTQKTFNPTAEGPLSGKTIVINAGHGWKANGKFDSGAEAKDGSDAEAYLNFDNAMRLKDELCNQGAEVLFIQGEYKLVNEALKNQSKLKNADLFISIHANSTKDPSVKDRTQFYVRQKEGNTKAGKESKELANIMESKFDKWIPANEDISKGEAFVDKDTKKQDYAQVASHDSRTGIMNPALKNDTPAVLWEVGFMSIDKGVERLNDDELMADYAQVATESIVEYLA